MYTKKAAGTAFFVYAFCFYQFCIKKRGFFVKEMPLKAHGNNVTLESM